MALRGMDGISAALAVTREDRFGDAFLVAYLVTAGGRALSVHDLRERLGEQVPDFSLPDQNGHVQTLESILGPNGALVLFHRSADW